MSKSYKLLNMKTKQNKNDAMFLFISGHISTATKLTADDVKYELNLTFNNECHYLCISQSRHQVLRER